MHKNDPVFSDTTPRILRQLRPYLSSVTHVWRNHGKMERLDRQACHGIDTCLPFFRALRISRLLFNLANVVKMIPFNLKHKQELSYFKRKNKKSTWCNSLKYYVSFWKYWLVNTRLACKGCQYIALRLLSIYPYVSNLPNFEYRYFEIEIFTLLIDRNFAIS